MKFNCGLTRTEKRKKREAQLEKISKWHPFFTLFPRRIASKDCRWLEWIERRGRIFYSKYKHGDHWWIWEYRVKQISQRRGSGNLDHIFTLP